LKTISVEKQRIITSSAPKIDRFVTRKRDGEKCENNIKQNQIRAGPSQVRFIKIGVLLL
jgi:hypothetical protein